MTVRKQLVATFIILGVSLSLAGYIATAARALSPDRLLSQCRLDSWGTRDGLPLLKITALAQTPDGYIWIGTEAGLYRFDGATFDRYDETNVRGLASSCITALKVDAAGRFWVGTARGGFGILSNGVYKQLWPVEPGWNVTRTFRPALTAQCGSAGISRISRFVLRLNLGPASPFR